MTTDSAYTSEMDAKNISATPSLNGNEPKVTVSPYTVSEAPASSVPPVSDYTTVQAVDSQQSLLLNPSTLPTKGTPMPAGYLTPEQLNSIMS
ncbi:Growth hormone receptor [Acipenser ruthenus]|uniref:Growth hormone receptor n=1 Tax=Acipenser ruthenus TaxID=7906 RepID=A0A444UU87_ACIRT|nr:Growth hormone receptor [Acipenser ruthenus]